MCKLIVLIFNADVYWVQSKLDLGMSYRLESYPYHRLIWVRGSRSAEDLGISIVSDLAQLLVPYPHHRG